MPSPANALPSGEAWAAALRGRPCGISRIRSAYLFDPRTGAEAVFIMFPRDVARRRFELYPENSAKI